MKNTVKLFGLIALVAAIGFSFAGCDHDGNKDNSKGTLSAGTYTGAATGTRTATGNATLNGIMNAGALDAMTAPSFEINTGGTMEPIFGSGVSAFLPATVQQNSPLYRFVVGSDNKLTLETRLWNGSNAYAAWENWNTRQANAIGATVVKNLSGSFNPSTGKVTLVFKYTLGEDSSSRTYDFTKQ